MAGRKGRRFRPLDGVLLLDKPVGISSNSALQKARYIFEAAKAGHTGSLDPLASGMLPVCFGEATKFSSYLLDANKRYRAVCQLGLTTTTGDQEGQVLKSIDVQFDEHDVVEVLARFRGPITQVPPMFSAVKHEGKRLYELARQGKEVERKTRQVEIFDLELIGLHGNLLEIEVFCSKGTYIRTLAEDIGEALGCGASLQSLRRTAVAPFHTERAWTLQELEQLKLKGREALDAALLPADAMLNQYPNVLLSDNEVLELAFGRQLTAEIGCEPGLCRLSHSQFGFLGLGEILEDGHLLGRRLVDTNHLLEKITATSSPLQN